LGTPIRIDFWKAGPSPREKGLATFLN